MRKSILSVALLSVFALTSCKKESKAPTAEEKPTKEEVVEVKEENKITPNYLVDTANSVIDWIGTKPGDKHTGTISLKQDSGFVINEGKITSGFFVLDMTSITVTDLTGGKKEGLETHLKGTGEKAEEDHFFNTNKFPTGTYTITQVTEHEEGKHLVTGKLTLKDITKDVNFLATITVAGNEATLVSDEFTINRTLWGVNYASKSVFDDLKDKFIDDEIKLTVKITAKQ